MRTNLPVTAVQRQLKPGEFLVSTTDPKGRITYANRAFVEISGFSEQELLGQAHNIVRHPDMPPAAFADLWKTLKAGLPWSGLVKNRAKNGDYYWVSANVAPVYTRGELTGYVSIRTRPGEQEVAAAEALYRDMREGRATDVRLDRGVVTRGWSARLRRRLQFRVRSNLLGLLGCAVLALSSLAWIAERSLADAEAVAAAASTKEVAIAAEVQASATRRRESLALVLGLALGIIGFGGWRTYAQIVGPLQRMREDMRAVASGNFDIVVRKDRDDEIGQVVDMFRVLHIELGRMLDRARHELEVVARIKSALDAASGGMLIANSEGIVTYANPSVLRSLRRVEKELQQQMPAFSADDVVGRPFHQFHPQPERPRGIVDGLADTHAARIRIGGQAFELFANPIFADDGARLGTALEWLDRSAESEFRHGLRNVVQRAAAGFLNARVEVKGDEERFRELADIVNGLIATTDQAIGEVEQVMAALASGRLGVRSQALLLGRFGELNGNVNRTAEALSAVITDMQQAVASINVSAAEISSGNNDLSARTEQASASIEETASALEQLTSTVRQTADHAQQARELASQASSVAEQGGAAVAAVVSTMQDIQQASRQMADIISTIDGIAFQTNILALNAAVEAARAGEQGRGFAVVASEVRALAQRSATAAREIAALIKGSVGRIEAGSNLVQQAGQRMDEIVASSRQVAGIVADITSATGEQSRGITEVSRAVNHLDQTTQANAALVEEIAAAAVAMTQETERLNAIAQRFER